MVPLDVLEDSTVSRGARVLFILLSLRAGADRSARDAMASLAGDLGCCSRTASRWTAQLERAGHVSRRRAGGRVDRFTISAGGNVTGGGAGESKAAA